MPLTINYPPGCTYHTGNHNKEQGEVANLLTGLRKAAGRMGKTKIAKSGVFMALLTALAANNAVLSVHSTIHRTALPRNPLNIKGTDGWATVRHVFITFHFYPVTGAKNKKFKITCYQQFTRFSCNLT